MRIIIDTGCDKGICEFANMGDLAMLQAAVIRLTGLWPGANLEVLTESAKDLAVHCPEATALAHVGRKIWLGEGIFLGRYAKAVPAWALTSLVELKKSLRLRYPNLLRLLITSILRFRSRNADAAAVTSFVNSMSSADLIFICGAGGFFDACIEWNTEILDLIEEAIRRRIPVVMLGQGFGPLEDKAIKERIKRAFPKTEMITLRGHRNSLELLQSLDVPTAKIETTGDEALELAYENRSAETGTGLGINFRMGGAAATEDAHIGRIKPVLQAFALKHSAPLIPLPIAMHPYSRDDLLIKRLMSVFDDQSDGGATLNTPLKVITQASRCRVVVTAAYHAAVFALGQGIPVVGLASSKYFSGKFLGLGDQFGPGCETIFLDDPEMPAKLCAALERAWTMAAELREPLQEAARRQIELTRQAYQRVKRIIPAREESSIRLPIRQPAFE